VLFSQFHDIVAGTAIEPAYDDAPHQLGEAMSIVARLANRSIQSIARQIDPPAESATAPVVVFNPQPWPVISTSRLPRSLKSLSRSKPLCPSLHLTSQACVPNLVMSRS
jgi:alpha-mannosidase